MRFGFWWEFYIRASSRHAMLQGPYREICARLGVRLRVHAGMKLPKSHRRKGIELLEAWYDLEAPSIEDANVHAFKDVQKLGRGWFAPSFHSNATTGLEHEDTCCLYGPQEPAFDWIKSAGLKVVEQDWKLNESKASANAAPRPRHPLVRISPTSDVPRRFVLECKYAYPTRKMADSVIAELRALWKSGVTVRLTVPEPNAETVYLVEARFSPQELNDRQALVSCLGRFGHLGKMVVDYAADGRIEVIHSIEPTECGRRHHLAAIRFSAVEL